MGAAPMPAPVSRLHRAALAYAERGWFVFPLEPGRKTPMRGSRGFQDASTNPAHVARWWTATPDANIGLWPGPSGLTVLDLDGPEGEARATELGLLAEPTLACISGRDDGGRHLYFRAPAFAVSNAPLGAHLDVRGQAGYVVLPPSRHPSGRRYRWAGAIDDIRALPPAVADLLRRSSGIRSPAAEAGVPDLRDPRPAPIAGTAIPDGTRNTELTRVVGALLAKHPLAEAVELAHGYNLAHCAPPLDREEIARIASSLARRESQRPARITDTGRRLAVGAPDVAPPDLPAPDVLAREQVETATERGRLDLSDAPRWAWYAVHQLVGIMVPGDLVVVGALMGNGKSSYLLSQLDWLATHGVPTLYLPLEIDAADVRRRWAAWKLGLDYVHVARNAWDELPEGAQDAHEAMLTEQATRACVHFPPDRRVTLPKLAQWIRWGAEHFGVRCVMVDHLHRLDFGGHAANYRVQVTEAVRAAKDLAREHQIALVAAAQLNQDGDPLDRYFPPSLRRLKESAGIGEEADTVLMLSRRLRVLLDADQTRAVRAGHMSERDFEAANTMQLTCRKHRLDDSARDRSVLLHVEAGRVHDRAPSWREGRE